MGSDSKLGLRQRASRMRVYPVHACVGVSQCMLNKTDKPTRRLRPAVAMATNTQTYTSLCHITLSLKYLCFCGSAWKRVEMLHRRVKRVRCSFPFGVHKQCCVCKWRNSSLYNLFTRLTWGSRHILDQKQNKVTQHLNAHAGNPPVTQTESSRQWQYYIERLGKNRSDTTLDKCKGHLTGDILKQKH